MAVTARAAVGAEVAVETHGVMTWASGARHIGRRRVAPPAAARSSRQAAGGTSMARRACSNARNAAGAVDRAVHSPAASERLIGGVDDHVRRDRRDVATDDGKLGVADVDRRVALLVGVHRHRRYRRYRVRARPVVALGAAGRQQHCAAASVSGVTRFGGRHAARRAVSSVTRVGGRHAPRGRQLRPRALGRLSAPRPFAGCPQTPPLPDGGSVARSSAATQAREEPRNSARKIAG